MENNIIAQLVANDGTKVILYPTTLVMDRTKAFSVAVGVAVGRLESYREVFALYLACDILSHNRVKLAREGMYSKRNST